MNAVNDAIALSRYQIGEQPTYSTGICGTITCGYGELDCNGYWEFPLDINTLTQVECEGIITPSSDN